MNRPCSPLVCLLVACAAVPARPAELQFDQLGLAQSELRLGPGEKVVELSDLNRDRHLDLIVGVARQDQITIWLGDGRGNFRQVNSVAAGPNPTAIEAQDLNGDSLVDLAVANHDTPHVTLLLGDGQGHFTPAPASPLKLTVAPHPHAVAAADLNGDGVVDLIIDDRDSRALRVLPALGAGQFALPGITVDVGGQPYLGFDVGDLDGDGTLDLVTPNANALAMVSNQSVDTWAFGAPRLIDARNPFAAALVDLNADQKLDLIAGSEGPQVQVFLADGESWRESPQSPFAMSQGAKLIQSGDLNGDHIVDVVIIGWSADLLVVLGGPTLTSARLALPQSSNPWGLAVGDINEDGRDDLIVADAGGADLLLFTSQPKR